jgi:large subunit ribosomal protein L14
MKSKKASRSRGISVGTMLRCADNTGAQEMEVISIKGYKGVMNRIPSAGIADLVMCAVKKGDPKMRHEVVMAVVIRQRRSYRRPDGIYVAFEDNAGVIVNEKFEPKGTEVKGPVAKEAVTRFSMIGKISSIVV